MNFPKFLTVFCFGAAYGTALTFLWDRINNPELIPSSDIISLITMMFITVTTIALVAAFLGFMLDHWEDK